MERIFIKNNLIFVVLPIGIEYINPMRVTHTKVNVVLNEALYSLSQLSVGPAHAFYSFHKGKFDPITVRNSADLVAVTKDQYAAWKNLDIRVIPVEVV